MTSLKPRAAVTLNGILFENCVKHLTVDSNNWFAADTFSVSLSYKAMPAAYGLPYLDGEQLEIGLLLDAGQGYQQIILGRADTSRFDVIQGLAEFSGRDRTADFIDTKTEAKYQNQTASQIATALATEHGLSSNVTATSTPSGKYYEIDHVRLTSGVSEWTLLNYLAQEEGFDCYVSGATLNFVPSQQGAAPAMTLTCVPGVVAQGGFETLDLQRSRTLAKDLLVKVTSWSAKRATAFTATATRGASMKSAFADQAQVYSYRVPGLTQDQAQAYANARLAEISKHERVVEVGMPGEAVLQPRNMVALAGTGTSFDQSYFIDAIHRRFDGETFSQTLTLKNHSTESQASL